MDLGVYCIFHHVSGSAPLGPMLELLEALFYQHIRSLHVRASAFPGLTQEFRKRRLVRRVEHDGLERQGSTDEGTAGDIGSGSRRCSVFDIQVHEVLAHHLSRLDPRAPTLMCSRQT